VKTISAAMVLYDEELMVDLSIKSAKDIVDEFVFVEDFYSRRRPCSANRGAIRDAQSEEAGRK